MRSVSRTLLTCRHERWVMMTFSSGIRGGAGRFPRAVAHVVAATLAVTAMVAAMWAGLVASASADTQLRVTSPSPARVKFYVVPPPANGHAESLFTIAAETLGDGGQFMEIFSLNKGRLQPNGGRLTNPRIIEPGWILQLPADAAGPGVQFGPLPVVTSPTSHRPSRPGGAGSAIMLSGALLAFVVAGLSVRLIRRRAGLGLRRRPMHARAPGTRATGRAGCSPTTRLTRPRPDPGRQHSRDCDLGRPPPHDDRPSWPHHFDPGPGWQSPAEGSGGAGRESGQGPQHGHDRSTALPPAPGPPQQAPVRSGSPAALHYPPAVLTPGVPGRASQPAWTPVPSPQAYFDVSRLQVAVPEPSTYDWERARGPGGRDGSVRLANPTLPDADHQAAEVRHQAPAEAAATRQPAGRDAAELRATLTGIQAELGRVAVYVAENLQSTAMAAAPAASPGTRPAARRTTKPATRPVEPVSRPAEPTTRAATPAAKPPGRPRQFRAMRLVVLAMTVPLLFGLIAATTELALHGYGYFVFRSAGTGATQQGPSGRPPSRPPAAAHHRRHAGPGQHSPPCASSLGPETARAVRTN